jgi:hypothetical protein
MKKSLAFILILSVLTANCLAQNENKHFKFFISAGYGLAGSFFTRSYSEWAPVSDYKAFYKKNFVGVSQNAAIGMNLKKNWEARFGINFQHFTRRIKSRDTLNGVDVKFDHDIHHRDYMWYGNFAKKFEKQNIFGV